MSQSGLLSNCVRQQSTKWPTKQTPPSHVETSDNEKFFLLKSHHRAHASSGTSPVVCLAAVVVATTATATRMPNNDHINTTGELCFTVDAAASTATAAIVTHNRWLWSVVDDISHCQMNDSSVIMTMLICILIWCACNVTEWVETNWANWVV